MIARLIVAFLFLSTLVTSDLAAQQSDIIGKTNADEIRTQHRIFDVYVKRYQPDSAAVKYLSSFPDSVKIDIIFGTWCHDSKKQIPAFIKTLEAAENPLIQANYYGVSRDKSDRQNFYREYKLKFTPTFIINVDGSEVGRIVEEPAVSMEQDLIRILKSGSASGG